MSNKLRFIHAADIHLGSFLHLSNNAFGQAKDIIDNAVFNAFQRIVDAALLNNVDFMVISGDMFESKSRPVTADNFFNEMMKKLNGIDVYLICGNHDPYREWKEIFKLPSNVHMLGCEEVESYDHIKDNSVAARIKGISYKTKKDNREVLSQFKSINSDVPGIAIFHSQMEAAGSLYMPASPADMLNTQGIDYWALGHIHKQRTIKNGKACAVYPGIPQGRDFGEEGVGGCILVEIDNSHNINLKYIPVSPVIFKKIEINIDDNKGELKDITDLEELITEKAEEMALKNLNLTQDMECTEDIENAVDGLIVEWIVKGRGTIHSIISGREDEIGQILAENINKKISTLKEGCFIHTDSVMFRIGADIPDMDDLLYSNPIYKELKNVRDQCLNDKDMRRQIIEALGEIWDEKSDMEDKDPLRFHLDEAAFETIMDAAEELIMEKLYDRGVSDED